MGNHLRVLRSLASAAVLLALALAIGAPGSSALDTSLAAMRVPGIAGIDPTLDGRGVVVAVLDTGVDGEHPMLAGAFFTGVDVSRPCPPRPGQLLPDLSDVSCYQVSDPPDNEGHGTHVAGILLGRPNPQGPRGVAPGARLVDVKIAVDLTPSTPGLTRGLLWVKQYNEAHPPGDAARIRVVSISAGSMTPGNESDLSAEHAQALVASGVVVVAAAGNCGGGADSACPFTGENTISSPAVAAGVIAVGAVDDRGTADRGDDVVAEFSSRGPHGGAGSHKPDVVAPGVNISSAWHHPLTPGAQGYWNASGTSMATPHVAGVAAILLQADPSLTPADVQRVLHQTAHRMDASVPSPSSGWGMVDALEAVRAVLLPRNAPPVARILGAPASLAEGQPMALDATLSEDDRRIASYEWQLGDGTSASGSRVRHAYAQPGTYDVVLTVTDGLGASGNATARVVVTEVPRVARIAVETPAPLAGREVALSANASEGRDGIVAYGWEFGDGAREGCFDVNCTGGERAVRHAYAAPGTYAARLTLRDGSGRVFAANASLVVRSPPATLALVATPALARPGEEVAFQATATAPGGVASLLFEFGDGESANGTAPNATHRYVAEGDITARVTLVTRWGEQARAVTTVAIRRAPLAVEIVLPGDAPVAGAPVLLDAGATDAGRLTWTFPDGTTAEGRNVTRAFAAGDHVVELRLEHADGRNASARATLRVAAPPAPPTPGPVPAPAAAEEPLTRHAAPPTPAASSTPAPPALLPPPATPPPSPDDDAPGIETSSLGEAGARGLEGARIREPGDAATPAWGLVTALAALALAAENPFRSRRR